MLKIILCVFLRDLKQVSKTPFWNLLTFKGYCELPSGVTTIGEELEIEITHCADANCFMHEVGYSSTMLDQMGALINGSSGCLQIIQFYCLSTPLIDTVSE